MSHGSDGFGSTELGAQASVLGAEIGLAAQQRRSPQSQCGGRTVEYVASPSSKYFVSADSVVWAQSQP
jgi:hypothetical protein